MCTEECCIKKVYRERYGHVSRSFNYILLYLDPTKQTLTFVQVIRRAQSTSTRELSDLLASRRVVGTYPPVGQQATPFRRPNCCPGKFNPYFSYLPPFKTVWLNCFSIKLDMAWLCEKLEILPDWLKDKIHFVEAAKIFLSKYKTILVVSLSSSL